MHVQVHMCEAAQMGRGCVNHKFKDQEEESYNVDIYRKLHRYRNYLLHMHKYIYGRRPPISKHITEEEV